MAKLEEMLANPLIHVGNNYFAGASYYLRTHRDLDKALEWINKAIEINGASVWYLQTKAEIFSEKGDYLQAIEVATNALKIAKQDGAEAYVEGLERLIKKWKTLKR